MLYPLKFSDLIVTHLDPREGPVKLTWASDPDNLIEDLPLTGLNNDRFYRPMFKAKESTQYTGAVLAIDPSGRGKDETAYAVVKFLHGNLFVMASGGFREGFSETTLKALASLAALHQVTQVVVEDNFGDGMFAQLLKPLMAKVHPVSIEEVKHSTQKERRICDTLEPVMRERAIDHRPHPSM